jgi:hypothetical protein
MSAAVVNTARAAADRRTGLQAEETGSLRAPSISGSVAIADSVAPRNEVLNRSPNDVENLMNVSHDSLRSMQRNIGHHEISLCESPHKSTVSWRTQTICRFPAKRAVTLWRDG